MALKNTPDTELYVAYQAGCMELPNGGDFSWVKGDRLRADHPAVKRLGEAAFVVEGTPRDEIPNLFEDVVSKMPKFGRHDDIFGSLNASAPSRTCTLTSMARCSPQRRVKCSSPTTTW